MKTLGIVNDRIYEVVKALMMFLLVTIAFLVVLAVFSRAVSVSKSFSLSLPWTEELAIYCFSWLSYFGAAVVMRNRNHIAITAFVDRIKQPMVKKTTIVLGQVIVLAFTCATAFIASQMVYQFFVNDLRSTSMQWLKMAFVFVQVPLSSMIYSLFMLEQVIQTLTGKEEQ